MCLLYTCRWLLIEGVGDGQLDAALEPVLLRQVFKQGGADCIRLGDAVVPYSSDFKLWLTTSLSNPHYPPETQASPLMLRTY